MVNSKEEEKNHNKNHNVKYWRIIGTLYPDNRLELMPGYITDNPQNSIEDPDSPLIAKLYDKEESLLLHYGVPIRMYVADGLSLQDFAVSAKIPFPEGVSIIRFFYRNDIMLHEIRVSEDKPYVKLTWEPSDNLLHGTHTITWKGSHPSNQPLQYFVRYTHNDRERWQRVGWRTDDPFQEIDFDQLPGGEHCKLSVVATDGVNTVTDTSSSFRVGIKPCIAMILSPQDGDRYSSKSLVIFSGQGFYMEENKPETESLTWISSRDGELGQGTILQTTRLSPGRHDITLIAGSADRAGKATISIFIE